MSNKQYLPRGSVWFQRMSKTTGGYHVITLNFEGFQDLVALSEWATSQGLEPLANGGTLLGAMEVYQTASQEPACPTHGAGAWVKRNKGRGKHKYYCAWSEDGGGYCGSKIQ